MANKRASKHPKPADAASLRQRAEALLRAKPSDTPTMPTADVQALVNELSVHQMELEIQNDELRQAQLELAQSRDRYANLYDFAPVGYVNLDSKSTILQANLAAAQILGVDRLKLIGQSLSRFMAPVDADKLFLHLRQTVQDHSKQSCQVCIAGEGGKQFDLQFESVTESIREGDSVHIQTAMIDVTERCGAERERERAAEALRESNRKLQQVLQELKQMQQQLVLQERLRAVGQLTSGVCHDLNNTLSPILGYSDLLMNRSDLPEDAHEYIRLINIGAHDAAAVVSRLREFCRAKGPQDLREVVDLVRLLDQVIDLTRGKWRDEAHRQGKDIEIQRELLETPPVFGDPSQLRELFTNLVFNAVDAIPCGGSITLRLRDVPEAVVAEVADTGIGMTTDVHSRCFEPFFTTKGLAGTGMGLSVCHGIIQRHDGRCEIDSIPGQGTTVRILLPRAERSHDSEAKPAEESLPRKRVLYVDDDARLRVLLSDMLAQLGQRVDTAEGGEASLSMIQTNEYDLVITDLGMPGMDGAEVTRIIKSRHPELPVVMLTGWGPEALNLRPDATPDYILSKPVTLPFLRAALAKVLR